MLKFAVTMFCLVIASGAWGEAQVVRAKWMLDVETGRILESPVIVIQQNKIVAAGSSATTPIPEGATVIDLGDSYLLPGLIDAHVHLAWGQSEGATIVGAEDALKTLMAGFTTVRNPGSTGMADLKLRDAINAGTVKGPRMLVSGPALGAKAGVCDQVFAGEAVVDSPQAAVQKVEELAERKVDLIKFCAGGRVIPSLEDAASKELDDATVRAIVETAHKHNLKVAAHAQGPAAIIQAATAGVDSIEHGGMIDKEAANFLKNRNVTLVPTLYRLDFVLANAEKSGAKPEALEKLREGRARARENIRMAVTTGVPIVFGTDATVIPHGDNALEFQALVQSGMTSLAAIQSATTKAANLLGWGDRVGQLKPGFFADMIAVRSDPLKNVEALRQIVFVMKDGKICLKSE